MRRPSFLLPPMHPGKILLEEYIKPSKMTITEIARALRCDPSRLTKITRQEHRITPDTCMRLAIFFNTSYEYWFNLQRSWDISQCWQKFGQADYIRIKPYKDTAANVKDAYTSCKD